MEAARQRAEKAEDMIEEANSRAKAAEEYVELWLDLSLRVAEEQPLRAQRAEADMKAARQLRARQLRAGLLVAAQAGHRAPVVPPQPDAMPVLQAAVKAFQKHFAAADAAGSTKTIEVLGSDQQNKDIAVLVRGQLCTALSRVMLHGFKSFKLIGRYHVWDFVNE
eukprot:4237154-Prymnesium_polylepis.1